MVIPKIIHQTWKTRILTNELSKWTSSWKNLNPTYEYRFYTDKDCWRFIYINYPEFIDLYNDITPVQKADVFRYLILYKYGGVYADMDTECLRSLDSLIENNCNLITGIEYEGNETGINNVQFEQWFIASPPGHIALLELVKEIEHRWWWRWLYSFVKTPNSLTYWLTGPEVFTEVLKNHNIIVMPKGILGSYDPKRMSSESYLVHYFSGSWKKQFRKITH